MGQSLYFHMQDSKREGLGKLRAENLSDGIFAVALTLLVVDLKPPNLIPSIQSDELRPLEEFWPHLLAYLASIPALGVYWIAHHNEFRLIRTTNRIMLWSNLVFLLFVVFVPFSTKFVAFHWQKGDFWQRGIPMWIFVGNMILVGLSLEWLWFYAARKDGKWLESWMHDPKEQWAIRETHIRNWILPVFYLLGGFCSLVNKIAWLAPWLLFAAPIFYVLYQVGYYHIRKMRKKT
jgi:uncharacterized membrane protein